MKVLAEDIGKGLFAGLAGTAAMTVSSTLEEKLRNRPPSNAPAKAAEKVLGIDRFASEAAESRFSNLVHWSYGTSWGAVRGVLDAVGLHGTLATLVHGAAVWSAQAVMLPALGLAPPVREWSAQEIAIDVFHHAVYASATGIAYELLE